MYTIAHTGVSELGVRFVGLWSGSCIKHPFTLGFSATFGSLPRFAEGVRGPQLPGIRKGCRNQGLCISTRQALGGVAP